MIALLILKFPCYLKNRKNEHSCLIFKDKPKTAKFHYNKIFRTRKGDNTIKDSRSKGEQSQPLLENQS